MNMHHAVHTKAAVGVNVELDWINCTDSERFMLVVEEN